MIVQTIDVDVRPETDFYSISINGEQLNFYFKIPEGLPENLRWLGDYSPNTYHFYYELQDNQGELLMIENKPENYAKWIQPFVDLWQAEKDRIEQEQQNAREEYAKFANRKERALNKIQEDYSQVLERGFVRTSLGFDADISCDSSATLLGTQTSLAYTMRTLGEGDGIPKTIFRDFYGLKRELDVVQVERLICEINGAQNHIREQKYLFKGRVKDETSDNESLNTVLEDCVYSTLDFSNLDEAGNPAEIQFNETKSIAERIDAPYM